MDDTVQQALAITPSSPAAARTVDITTIGRRSGRPHRIETWFYRVGDKFYLTGMPGKRDWYANLQANPAFTFHLKNSVTADLPATARLVTDEQERRQVFTEIVAHLNQPGNPGGITQPTSVDAWMAGSPLAEISFDE